MLQLAEGLSVPHTSILVFCTLQSNSFLPLIYYKVLFFLAKMPVINRVLAVPLIGIDHCQQLHPPWSWLGHLQYPQPVKGTSAGLCCPPSPQLDLSLQPDEKGRAPQPSSLICRDAFHGQDAEFSSQNRHLYSPSVPAFWSSKWEWY